MKVRTLITIATLSLAFSAACRHRSPTTILHTLRPLAEKTDRPQPFTTGVEVLRVRVPNLLQRSQLVYPREAGGFVVSETHRWGNGLEADLQRVLVSNLSILLGSDAIVAAPASEAFKINYRLGVEVLACEGSASVLRIEARWTLLRPLKQEILLQRKTELQEPIKGDTAEALVSAYERLMTSLGREIAAGIEGQENAKL